MGIETNKLLRERCYGVLELRRHEEFCLAAEAAGFQGENRYDFVPEGAESKPDVRKRAAEFLEYVFKSVSKNDKSSEETHNILVVSHSGFLVQLAHHFFKDCDCSHQYQSITKLKMILAYGEIKRLKTLQSLLMKSKSTT